MDEEQRLREDDRKSRPFRAARVREAIELFPDIHVADRLGVSPAKLHRYLHAAKAANSPSP
jgi:hypothetical protein